MTKIKRDSRQIEPCSTSIAILKEKCESFFNNYLGHKSTCRVYVDDPSEISLGSSSDEIVDFILFGNAFKKIYESGNWIGNKVRIWVLSSSNKIFLDSLFKHKVKVNLIPRYLLFEKNELVQKFKCGEGYDFVYAGRLSAQKNIESLLLFIRNYNEEYSLNCSLSLFGLFEDTYHEDTGKRLHGSYKESILALIDELGIEGNVKIMGEVDPSSWAVRSFDRPLFISLSTFISEDFGCSIAEAQAQGWPCIISNYGGHRDVVGENIIKVPSSYICNSHTPVDLQNIVSVRLVKDLSSMKCSDHVLASPNISNHIVDMDTLDVSRRTSLLKIGASISLIHSDYIGAFADTIEGSLYLHEFKRNMKDYKHEVTIIIYDYDERRLSESQIISLNKIYSKINLNTYEINLISSKNLFFKDSMKRLLSSDKIFVALDRINVESLKDFLHYKLYLDLDDIYYE